MSFKPSDLRYYGSANMSDGDGTTQGGAVDFTKKVTFADITPNGLMDYVSSAAGDVAVTLTATMRSAAGTRVTEAKVLTGTTPVLGATTAERLLKVVATGTAAVGDVAAISHTKVVSAHTCQNGSAASTGITPPLFALQAGDGAAVAVGQIIRVTNNTPAGVQFALRQIIDVGTYGADVVALNADLPSVPTNATTYDVHQGMLLEVSPNAVTQCRAVFYDAAADFAGGATRTYFEKIFAVNNGTSFDLTDAIISKQSDPVSGTIDFALCNALNDVATVANRQTAPVAGITAFSAGAAPQSINVPNANQNLPSGAAPNAAGAQGIWLRQTLTAGLAPAKVSFSLRTAGATT